jgi:SAM-dependent methyltransferase
MERTTLVAAVRQFWDRNPCGTKNTGAERGTLAFYRQVEAHRYHEEFHIPLVAEFDQHASHQVLEVGCGLGTDGRQFARGGARYTGCDLSLESLRLARRGFGLFGLTGDFVCTDAADLPFCDSRFDIVYSHGVLHHVPSTVRAINEVHRVLRPGGTAIIMLYAAALFGYLGGAHSIGRLRLELTRLRMGPEAFNALVGLPADHRGWLPDWVVINNSTDGLGNPLSRLFSRQQIQEMFQSFSEVHIERHYFPRRKLPLIGPLLPRRMAHWLGRTLGTFWYIKAVK